MSTFAESLKKQNELLQGEVERFANAVDSLAAQLVDVQNQLKALQETRPEMVPDDSSILVEGEAVDIQIVAPTAEKRLRAKR